MALYPYRCASCGASRDIFVPVERADSDPTKALYDKGQMSHECGGAFRRVWKGSVHISTYRNTVWDPRREQYVEVTSEAEFKKVLKVQSDKATDYTGIQHDIQPIDFDDPSRGPSSDEALKSQHDAAVQAGKKESKGRFVHDIGGGS